MTNTIISGWFETEEGARLFQYENVEDYETLAQHLYLDFTDECYGVDMEIEGEYLDGSDVNTHMIALLDDLDYLCN
jgi:hypothetical protein